MPFSGGNSQGGGESINHFAGVRLRVKGTGNLIPTLIGFDSVLTQTLATIPMSTAPGLQPLVLSNFIGQRVQLQLQTTAIDAQFDINRIVVFAKELWGDYPR